MANLIGKTLGPYRVIDQIGLGGMATVYKAYQPSMDRYVALKVLSTHLSQTPAFVKRFQQEAKMIAKLEHLHILPVYDHDEEGDYLYLVMRYIEAGTLKDRLNRGALSLEDTRRVVSQVGSALEYAHQMGVVHRDLKPSNILVDRQGDCYLTDFGIARMVEGALGMTGSNIIGTPQYMAPEQGESARVDHRADIYAMGVVIYEMLTGRPPYDAETPFAVVLKHLTEPLPLPRNLRPNLPEEVERVMLKALAKNPADRYQSMAELVAAFDRAVEAAPAGIAQVTPAAPLAATAEPVATGSLPASSAWRRWLAAQPPWLLGAAVLGLIVLVVAGLILSQVPGRVEISGGQVQVILPTDTVMPTILPLPTATEAAVVIPPTITAPPTREKITATPKPTSTRVVLPTVAVSSAVEQAPALAGLVDEAVAGRNWAEALTAISEAIKLDPANPQYYLRRAFIYDAGLGQMDKAVADASMAIELAPSLVEAWKTRGTASMHGGECGPALLDIEQAIALDPERFDSYVDRADVLRCLGRFDEAIADYGRGLALNPSSSWAYWTRGMLYEQKGDLAAALADYGQAITLQPDDAWASTDFYNSRAGVYRALDQHRQALADCQMILQLIPNDPRGFYCRGMSELAQGEEAQARADLEQAVTLTPVSAWSEWVTEAARAEMAQLSPATSAPVAASPHTSVDQGRAFAEPILAAIANRKPNFEDDFSTASAGWEIDTYDNSGLDQFAIENGQLRLFMGGPRTLTHVRHPSVRFNDFVLVVDAIIESPGSVEGPGIGWRYSAEGAHSFVVWTNHVWETRYCNSSECEPNYASGDSGEIVAGKPVQLMVVAKGNTFALYLDGQPLAYADDPSRPPGVEISLFAHSNAAERSAIVAFDNFKIWNLADLSGL
jgi:tetratricopeptide (TPR) repeat protein